MLIMLFSFSIALKNFGAQNFEGKRLGGQKANIYYNVKERGKNSTVFLQCFCFSRFHHTQVYKQRPRVFMSHFNASNYGRLI